MSSMSEKTRVVVTPMTPTSRKTPKQPSTPSGLPSAAKRSMLASFQASTERRASIVLSTMEFMEPRDARELAVPRLPRLRKLLMPEALDPRRRGRSCPLTNFASRGRSVSDQDRRLDEPRTATWDTRLKLERLCSWPLDVLRVEELDCKRAPLLLCLLGRMKGPCGPRSTPRCSAARSAARAKPVSRLTHRWSCCCGPCDTLLAETRLCVETLLSCLEIFLGCLSGEEVLPSSPERSVAARWSMMAGSSSKARAQQGILGMRGHAA
mmetsp:Transcript_8173/g.22975  ORF Transcript_8173/g.22975 Transcript_8173/m.22975 type:complete len:266 (-) Transcript_8173:26-823(-)